MSRQRKDGKRTLEKSRVGGDFPEYLVGFLQECQNCPHHRTFHQPLDIPFEL